MNIFCVDYDPKVAGSQLPSKLATKMCTETPQLLSDAVHCYGVDQGFPIPNNYTYNFAVKGLLTTGNIWFALYCRHTPIYKKSYYNHPSSVWTRENRANYGWLVAHFEGLLENYTNDYGKTHKAQKLAPIFEHYRFLLPEGRLTNFPRTVNNKELLSQYRDTVELYRAYIAKKPYVIGDKVKNYGYKRNNAPQWLLQHLAPKDFFVANQITARYDKVTNKGEKRMTSTAKRKPQVGMVNYQRQLDALILLQNQYRAKGNSFKVNQIGAQIRILMSKACKIKGRRIEQKPTKTVKPLYTNSKGCKEKFDKTIHLHTTNKKNIVKL